MEQSAEDEQFLHEQLVRHYQEGEASLSPGALGGGGARTGAAAPQRWMRRMRGIANEGFRSGGAPCAKSYEVKSR